MAQIWSCQGLSKTWSAKALFNGIDLALEDYERLGLMGPNGSGKSTLMKIVAGREQADAGVTAVRKGARVYLLDQSPQFDAKQTLQQIVEQHVAPQYVDHHEREFKAAQWLERFAFVDKQQSPAAMSGGQIKRLALACAFASEAELMLFDEPTNHLDLEGILLLEELINSSSCAMVVISHDRYFLNNTMSRLCELNKVYDKGLFSISGDYTEFLLRKDEYLNAQTRREESLSNKVRRELEWLRAGVQARTTKSSARIQSALQLDADLQKLRQQLQQQSVKLEYQASNRKTKQLIVAKGAHKSYGGRTLFDKLDLVLTNGMRLGIIGVNGSGKSTLLKMLAGKIKPDHGSLFHADSLKIVYFDQMHAEVDLTRSLRKTLAPEGDYVSVNGKPVHINGYAKRFQLQQEQLDLPVSRLSGGERARLVIAKLMLEPADILLLDEPTNDLDMETLESLEESLLEFPGAVVLITHDRFLLDRVSTAILGLEGNGKFGVFASFSQWQDYRRLQAAQENLKNAPPASAKLPSANEAAAGKPKKLSYMEQREWDAMEATIMNAEQDLVRLQQQAADLATGNDLSKLKSATESLHAAEKILDTLYTRWAELEAKRT